MTGAFDRLDRWSAWASRGLYRIGVYGALPALVVLVTADVVLRYFFNAPLHWVRDANGVLLLVALFSALPHAWDRGFHIRMELFRSRFTERRRAFADVASAWCGVVFFGLVAAQAFLFVPYMATTGETGEDLMLPLWPMMGFMGICSIVFVARLIANPVGGPPDDQGQGTRGWI